MTVCARFPRFRRRLAGRPTSPPDPGRTTTLGRLPDGSAGVARRRTASRDRHPGPYDPGRGDLGAFLGACEPKSGHVPAVRLRGARITGVLNVSGGEVGCELRLERCVLEEAPDFSNARA